MRPRALAYIIAVVALAAALLILLHADSDSPSIVPEPAERSTNEAKDKEARERATRTGTHPATDEDASATRTPVTNSLKPLSVFITKDGAPVESALIRSLTVTADVTTSRTSGSALPDDRIQSAETITTDRAGSATISRHSNDTLFVAAWAEMCSPMGIFIQPETEELDLQLAPGQQIEGVVVQPDGAPIAGATVTAARSLFLEERFYPDLTGVGERLAARFFPRSTKSGVDGAFSIDGLPMAMVEAWAAKPGYSSVGIEELWPPDSAWFKAVLAPTEARVSGIIRDAATHQPVHGAKVWVSAMTTPGAANPIATASSDRKGEFDLHGIPPKQSPVIVCWMEGYATQIVDLSDVEHGTHRKVTLDLTPGSVARGRIEAPEGGPISEALIQVSKGPLSAPVEFVTSLEDGSFEIPGLDPAARYTFYVSAWLFTPTHLVGINGNDQDIVAVLSPTSTIVGRVLIEGAPATTGTIRITASKPSGTVEIDRSTQITEHGQFLFESVDQRAYRLEVFVPGRAPTTIDRIDVTNETADVGDIEALTGPILRGRVTDQKGRGVSGAKVSLGSRVDGTTSINASLPVETVTAADGTYELGPVAPGIVGVIVDHPDFAIATRSGQVPDGAASWQLDVEVTLAGAIEIRVIDPLGAAVQQFAAGTFATKSAMKRTERSSNGSIRIERLPAGPIEAWSFIDPSMLESPLAGQQFGQFANVIAGRTTTVTFDTREGHSLQGIVLPAVPPRPLTAYAERVGSHTGFERTSTIRADGSFSLSSLAADTYRVYVETSDDGPHIYASAIVTLPQPDDQPVQILLGGGEVRGQVTAQNRPVAQAQVFIFPRKDGPLEIPSRAAARTFADGTFGRTGLTPGRYQWFTKKDGFSTESGELTVQPGSHRTSLSVEIYPEAELLVRVENDDGERVTPDSCHATPHTGVMVGAKWKASAALVGDAHRIGRLPSGGHDLVVRAAGYFPHFETIEITTGGSHSADVVLRRSCVLELSIVNSTGVGQPGVAWAISDNRSGISVDDWIADGQVSRATLHTAPRSYGRTQPRGSASASTAFGPGP